MKRLLLVTALSTIALVLLVLYRGKSFKSDETRVREAATNLLAKMAAEYAAVKTVDLTPDMYLEAVRTLGATNLNRLNDGQREKLYRKIKQFYECYSSGDFEKYRAFRLEEPYAVPGAYAAAITKLAADSGATLGSDADILRYAWRKFNGTNRLARVDTSSIKLFLCDSADLGMSLRRPSIVGFPGSAVTCWEGAVSYNPSPQDLLNRQHSLLFFCLDQFARMNNLTDGPATPLRLVGYWDPDHADWRPLYLCSPFQVAGFDTIF